MLRALARRRHGPTLAEYRRLRRLARRAGYHVVRADYYSPIPELDAIPEAVWTEPASMPGVDWDLDAQLAFVATELRPFLDELDAPEHPPGTREGFYIRNQYFPAFDAEVLHAIVRKQRPARILELGSGFSTLLIRGALRRNAADGWPSSYQIYDPFPSPALDTVRDDLQLNRTSATDIPPARFEELRSGDVLFIDTTHTVKPGGEVNRLMLEVLPSLNQGVLIHIHDFFRPFEYPRVLLDRFGVYWQEHHLVQAFLSFNPGFEILCANHALSRLKASELRHLIPSLAPDTHPSSLWLRRR